MSAVGPRLYQQRREWERRYVKRALERHGYDLPKVADNLGIHLSALYVKCHLLGIKVTRRERAILKCREGGNGQGKPDGLPPL